MCSVFCALRAGGTWVASFFESVNIVGLLFTGLILNGTEGTIFFGCAAPDNLEPELIMPVYLI